MNRYDINIFDTQVYDDENYDEGWVTVVLYPISWEEEFVYTDTSTIVGKARVYAPTFEVYDEWYDSDYFFDNLPEFPYAVESAVRQIIGKYEEQEVPA